MAMPRKVPTHVTQAAAQLLASDAVWLARIKARQLSAMADSGLAACGLTHAQLSLMCLIAGSREDTIGDLAKLAQLDQSTMSRNLDVLARAGLIEVTTAIADRRRRAVWLTEQGLFRLAAALPIAKEVLAQIANAIGAPDT
jgi:DNA-binding MarR family transcriptional regulator